MPRVVAWLQDEDRSGAATGLTSIADQNQNVQTSGDLLRWPPGFDYIFMGYHHTEFAGFPTIRATISGSGRRAANPMIFNKGIALNYLSPGQVYDMRGAPRFWPGGEDVSISSSEADEAGVAHHNGLVLFMSRSPAPVPVGVPPLPITHYHAVTIGSMTIVAWTTSALTELNTLPPGEYIQWGGRVQSATPLSFRMIYPGIDDRIPLIPSARAEDPVHSYNEYWGTDAYRFTIPDALPSIEGLCEATETPSELEMYLTKVNPGTMTVAPDAL